MNPLMWTSAITHLMWAFLKTITANISENYLPTFLTIIIAKMFVNCKRQTFLETSTANMLEKYDNKSFKNKKQLNISKIHFRTMLKYIFE